MIGMLSSHLSVARAFFFLSPSLLLTRRCINASYFLLCASPLHYRFAEYRPQIGSCTHTEADCSAVVELHIGVN